MNTLIVYGTKYGCTEKCATILSEKLMGKVDLYNIKEKNNADITRYDKVIIGGSIYVGKIQKEVMEFCLKNLNDLKEKKIGLFICCMQSGSNAETQLNNSFPQELLLNTIARECFGGELIFKKMNILERFMTKMVSKGDKSLPATDKNENVSIISEDNINRFTQVMNNC